MMKEFETVCLFLKNKNSLTAAVKAETAAAGNGAGLPPIKISEKIAKISLSAVAFRKNGIRLPDMS